MNYEQKRLVVKQTIELVAGGFEGVTRLIEVPIVGTFELRGEMFALITDHDYFTHVYPASDPDEEEDDCCGELFVTHVGTGCNAGGSRWFASPEAAKVRVDQLWKEGVDPYEIAASKGYPKVRGTVVESKEAN